MQITFKGKTQDEIKSQIVEAGLNTESISHKFSLPWHTQSAPDIMPVGCRGKRISVIKQVRNDLGIGLKDAKELVDYILCCFEQVG